MKKTELYRLCLKSGTFS